MNYSASKLSASNTLTTVLTREVLLVIIDLYLTLLTAITINVKLLSVLL